MKKGTKLYSILNNKCPRCHEGDFFDSKNPYDFKRLSKMPEHCANCGLKFEPETGFYYGAMYVSYALGVAIFVAIWVAIMVLAPTLSAGYTVAFVTIGLVVFFPISFRLARKIWINIFIKYEGDKKKLQQNS